MFLKRFIGGVALRMGYQISRVESFDPWERYLRFLKNRGFSPKCILDVGANECSWSKLAMKLFDQAQYVLIEPQPEMLPHLQAFCQAHPNARYVLAGAGSQPGELTQTIWDDLQGSSFLPPVEDGTAPARKKRVVPIVTIDSLFTGDQPLPDFVKLDIQGFELEALKGATRLFGYTECFVLEVSLYEYQPGTPTVAEVIAFMNERGYVVYDFCGITPRPLDGALGQMDIAFVRKTGLLRASHAWK